LSDHPRNSGELVMSDHAVDQLRVLIHAPVGKDGKMIAEVLNRAQIQAEACAELEMVADELAQGVGVLIIADDALKRSGIDPIAAWLRLQPRWSDLPIIIMTTGGEADPTSIHRLRLIDPLGNVTLIERPVRRVTLVSTVRTAIRARKRQYEIRDHLEELKRSEEPFWKRRSPSWCIQRTARSFTSAVPGPISRGSCGKISPPFRPGPKRR
jgi:DNA-binding NtrC family response regulator